MKLKRRATQSNKPLSSLVAGASVHAPPTDGTWSLYTSSVQQSH